MTQSPIIPSWVPYTGFNLKNQKFPDILYFQDSSKPCSDVTEFRDLSALYRTNVIGFKPQEHEEVLKKFLIRTFQEDEPYSSVAFGMQTEEGQALASRLLEITNLLEGGVAPSTSGSMAVTNAIHCAWAYHSIKGNKKTSEKTKIISLERSYHGSTPTCLSASHYSVARKNITGKYIPEDIKNIFQHIPSPYKSASIVDTLRKKVSDFSQVAAIVVEPIQGAGSVVPNLDYFKDLNEFARENDFLIIADEVAMFARTGKWLASQTYGFKPDIVTLAKGISNGFSPMSAALFSKKVRDVLDSDGNSKEYGETNAWNPLGVAIVTSTLDTISENDLLTKGAELGTNFRAMLGTELTGKEVKYPPTVNGIGAHTQFEFKTASQAKAISERLRQQGYYAYASQGAVHVDFPLVEVSYDLEELVGTIFEVCRR